MPVRSKSALRIDYTDDGAGESVVLVHSSVSGSRQWRALVDALKDRFRVLALNLFGYGETTRWSGTSPQTLYAQAQLVLALCEDVADPVHLVGHSFGATVSMKAASLLGRRVGKLVLLEPNPFHLLKQHGRTDAFLESRALRDHVKCFGSLGDWTAVAERFADYWMGDGSWATMPEKRRQAFMQSLPPVFHEWDAVMDEETPVGEWSRMPARTLVVSTADTRRPIREIVAILARACPGWRFEELPEGGHMAPLTRPDLVNPIVRRFLETGAP
ncbi:Cis-3-alkyl-4-alkyloxetan-2-one decarboxylase [Burkholderiales bacterium]|nr:Cis-3-alkyl-4-alkyloxetan-2-one decarboxylase [Burkholderiales bacterium]